MHNYINPRNIDVIEKIGSGTFSDVFKVKINDKEIAYKKFNISTNGTIDIEVFRELSVLSLLNHKPISIGLVTFNNIVYENNSNGVTIGYTLELYKKDLRKCILEKDITYSTKLSICNNLLKSLYFLHSNKIIHRDIKPDNIFIDNDNNAILGDYSLSKVFSDRYNEGTHTSKIATITYRSPEVVNNDNYSYKADIWSLGVTLYELYTDSLLNFDTDIDTLNFIEKKMKEKINTKKDPLFTIIKKCLVNSPRMRLNLKKALKIPELNNKISDIKQIGKMCWELNTEQDISDDIEEMSENFEVEKTITKQLAQRILDETNFHSHGAVSLASKFYETEPMYGDLNDDYDYKDFYNLFLKMDFNLYL